MKMKSLFTVSCLAMACLSAGAQETYEFQNTKLSDEKRIDALMEELTLDEKITLLGSDLAVPRLGILPAATTKACTGGFGRSLRLGRP